MRTPFSLDGRVALVTGASSGIGAHFAQTLANAGAKVAIVARREAKLVALSEQIQKSGGRALPVVMDVTEAASIDHAITEVETELGPIAHRRQQCRHRHDGAGASDLSRRRIGTPSSTPI